MELVAKDFIAEIFVGSPVYSDKHDHGFKNSYKFMYAEFKWEEVWKDFVKTFERDEAEIWMPDKIFTSIDFYMSWQSGEFLRRAAKKELL